MPLIHHRKNRGSSLVETVIYIAIFTFLSGAIMSALFALSGSYALIKSSVALETAAQTTIEKIARAARDSLSIDATQSTFGVSSGVLTLNEEGGTAQFLLADGVVRMREDGVDIGPLSSEKVRVTSLIFRRLITPNSEGVRIEMAAESGQGADYKAKTFYTTAVVRGSYAP